jgi:hypothetical protein
VTKGGAVAVVGVCGVALGLEVRGEVVSIFFTHAGQ